MCLDCLISKSRFPDSGVGFKVVCPLDEVHFQSVFSNRAPWDTWLFHNPSRIKINEFNHYTAGFHFYTEEKGCREYLDLTRAPQCFVQVQYRGLLEAGVENGHVVLVAKEIYVPSVAIRDRDSFSSVPRYVDMQFSRKKGFWYRNFFPWDIRDTPNKHYVPCLYSEEHDAVYLT